MWKTLSYTGINLEPEYKSHKIPIKINNEYVILDEKLEEILTKFTINKCYINIQNDKVFEKNFLNSIGNPQLELSRIDFVEFHNNLKKIPRPNCKRKYNVYVNGRIIEDMNPMIEHSCIFKGRGKHSLRGTYKPRITSKDVTLNMSENKLINKRTEWNKIITNRNGNWIACWNDKVTKKTKYIKLTSNDDINIEKKFNQARKLRLKMNYMKSINDKNISSENPKLRQLALATFLIYTCGIRIGNEDEYTTTMGCCSLKKGNVKLIDKNKLVLDFIGKDSIPYKRIFKIRNDYCREIKQFKEFDMISPSILNKYLSNIIDGNTAKVFRTCNANIIFLNGLKKPDESPLHTLKNAVIEVAKYCNHCVERNDKYVYSTSTCKRHYIDPRIIFSYCKKHNIDIKKVYNTELIKYHSWAQNISKDYVF